MINEKIEFDLYPKIDCSEKENGKLKDVAEFGSIFGSNDSFYF